MKTKEFIDRFHPCRPCAAFALEYETMAEVWENCPRVDWLLATCRMMEIKQDKQFRLFAVWCIKNIFIVDGKTTWDWLTHERSRNAVVVSEKFANGEVSAEELRVASIDANSIEDYLAQSDASRAANAAAHTDANSAAANVAFYVTQVAAYPISTSLYDDTGRIRASAEQATQFRKMIPNPFQQEASK